MTKVKNNGVYQNGNSRILVIQMEKDDPSQYTKIVNGLFAAQKIQVTIDALILKETCKEYLEREFDRRNRSKQGMQPSAFKQSDTPYLLIQAA